MLSIQLQPTGRVSLEVGIHDDNTMSNDREFIKVNYVYVVITRLLIRILCSLALWHIHINPLKKDSMRKLEEKIIWSKVSRGR